MKYVEALRKNLTCEKWTQLKLMQIRSNTPFFYRQRFFSTQPQCCLAFSWIEIQMLLRSCLIDIAIIILRHILYLVFMSMPRPRSIHVVYMRSIFHFQSHFHCHYSSFNQTCLLFVHILECLPLFLDNLGWRKQIIFD